MERLEERIRKIQVVVFDVDGVLTDGSIIYDDEGRELKVFNVKDGHGIKLLKRCGIECAIMTSRRSRVVDRRAEELGIEMVIQGAKDKLAAYREFLDATGYSDEEIAYVGDDLVDLPVMRRVGLAISVCDAVEEAREVAHYVTENRGGRGAAREVAELIIKTKGLWDKVMERYRR